MFINTSILKKMIKNAYAGGGVSVARLRQKYVIAGDWWCIRVRADAFPAKDRAAAIEFISEFPQTGEKFTVSASEEKKYGEFNERWRNMANEKYVQSVPDSIVSPIPTCLFLEGTEKMCRMWQGEDKKIFIVPEQVDNLVSSKHIDKKIEMEPDAPISIIPEAKMSDVLYWKNNCCELWVACARGILDKFDEKEDREKEEALKYTDWPKTLKVLY